MDLSLIHGFSQLPFGPGLKSPETISDGRARIGIDAASDVADRGLSAFALVGDLGLRVPRVFEHPHESRPVHG
jgi:hypothetical protein